MNKPKKISTQTPFGELTAVIGADPNYPEIFVYLKRPDGVEIDLTVVTAGKNAITAYIYENVHKDDYTECHHWSEPTLNYNFEEEN